MKKSCHYCGSIHDVKHICAHKPVRNKYDYNNSSDERKKIKQFRSSSSWTKKRDEIQDRDLRLCQVCIRDLYGTWNIHTSEGTSVHHIVQLTVDWDKRLDSDNLLTLCSQHHADAERGYIPAEELRDMTREQEAKGETNIVCALLH